MGLFLLLLILSGYLSAVVGNNFIFFSTFNSDTLGSVYWSSRDVIDVSFVSSRVSDVLLKSEAHENSEVKA